MIGRLFRGGAFLAVAILVASCASAGPTAAPTSTPDGAGLPNPAAVYCQQQGGKSDERRESTQDHEKGGQGKAEEVCGRRGESHDEAVADVDPRLGATFLATGGTVQDSRLYTISRQMARKIGARRALSGGHSLDQCRISDTDFLCHERAQTFSDTRDHCRLFLPRGELPSLASWREAPVLGRRSPWTDVPAHPGFGDA